MTGRLQRNESVKVSLLLAAVVLQALCASFSTAIAAENVQAAEASDRPSQAAQPLRFIRVFAPAAEPDKWPRGPGRYLPLENDEFSRLLERAQAADPLAHAPTADIAAAEYRARLEADGVLHGTARLQISLHGEEPVLMPLDPCRLAINAAKWAGDGDATEPDSETQREKSAVLGAASQGGIALLVERAGTVVLDWTTRGDKSMPAATVEGTHNGANTLEKTPPDDADLEFSLELPPCPSNVLFLDLPPDLVPQVERAIVSAVEETAISTGPTTRRWRIEPGGRNRFKLSLRRIDKTAGARPAVCARQSLVYDLSERGLEASSTFRLDVANSPIDRLEISVERPLRVFRVQSGDKAAAWSVKPEADEDSDRVTLELPAPIRGNGLDIQVWAYCPLVADRTWRLPRIRAASVSSGIAAAYEENIFWEQGDATLIVSDPLEMIDLEYVECRQLKTVRLPPPAAGESHQIQLFSPNAAAEIKLSAAAAPPLVDCGVAAVLDTGDITAKTTANLRSIRSKHFRIEADLSPQWIVDSVESLPADAIKDWDVENQSDGTARLVVRLSKPLSPAQGPLKLLASLHNPRSPLGRNLTVRDIMPLVFSNCEQGKTLLAVQAVEPHQLNYRGDSSAPPREAGAASEADLRLFAEPPKGMIFSPEEADETMSFSLQRKRPSYDAAIQTEARASDDLLTEYYRISCSPRASQVERVLIHFSRARDSVFRWRLNSQDNRQATARRLTASEEAAAGLGPQGETWEVSLPLPCGDPFEIAASRVSKTADKTELSLAALPEASQQKARLVVKSAELSATRFENHGLEPIAARTIEPDRYSTTRAAYRYDPRRAIAAPGRETVMVLPRPNEKYQGKDAPETPPSAWAWSCHLESLFNTDGTAYHSACYRIENTGRGWLKFDLPQNIAIGDVEGVWVNDQSATWQTAADKKSNGLQVALPDGLRFPVVRINFISTDAPLGMGRSLQPLMPQADISVLRSCWTVWLPPGYASSAGEYETLNGYAAPCASPSITQRIFGPLGKRPGANTFDPFSAPAWKKTAAVWLDRESSERSVTILLERIGRLSMHAATAAAIFNDESLGAVERSFLTDTEALAAEGISPATVLADVDGGAAKSDEPATAENPTAEQLPPAPLPPNLKSAMTIDGENGSTTAQIERGNPSDAEAAGRAVRLLRRSGLALLVQEKAIILTTSLQAAVYAEHLRPLGGGVVWLVDPGALHDWISAETDATVENGEYGALLPISEWTSPNGPIAPWSRFASLKCRSSDAPGWSALQMDISGDAGDAGNAAVSLSVIHRQSLEIFRWAAFILTIAVGCWKGAERPLRTATVAAVFAIMALFSPVLVSTICSGIVLGLLFCLGLRLIRRKTPTPEPPASASNAKPSSPASTAAYVGAGMALACFLIFSHSAKAQVNHSDRATAYRVIVPVEENKDAPEAQESVPEEENKKEAGDRVFVPEELYEKLQSRASAAMGRPRGWMITSAVYRGVLSSRGKPEKLTASDLHAVFEIRLFDSQAEVRIPLKKSDVAILAGGCLLDGRPVQPQWSGEGEAIVVNVEQAGRHRLELGLQPLEKPNLLDVAIPRLPVARLELVLPVGETKIETPTAGGPVKKENGMLIAEFGGRDRLSLRCSGGAAGAFTEPSVEAEELLWMKVRPGSVVVDVKYTIKVNSGEVRELMLAADPRLRLMERGDSADIVESPGNPHLRIVRFTAPCTDSAVVTARFLLRDGSGIGNVRPPHLSLSGVKATVQLLAVTIDDGLAFSQQGRRPSVQTSVNDFLASWGQSTEKPQFVFPLEDIDPGWSISAYPRRPPLDAAQSLIATFGRKTVALRFDAKLTDAPGSGFQYTIAAPKSLAIQYVSVVEEGVDRVSRWTRGDDGSVHVFLTGPAAVARNLALVGHMPAQTSGKFTVPTLRLENSRRISDRIALFRDRSVLVSLDKYEGLIESDGPPAPDAGGENKPANGVAAEAAPKDAVLYKNFTTDGTDKTHLEVVLSPNIPKTEKTRETGAEIAKQTSIPATSKNERGGGGVGLADFNVAWREDGTFTGTATFDLTPDGRRWCPLWIPKNIRLVETRLDNVVGVPEEVGVAKNAAATAADNIPRKYRLQLASRTMAQRIELIFQGSLPLGRWTGREIFDFPRLGDLKVEKTLWRVFSPRRFSPYNPATDAVRLEQELIRLENVAAIIEKVAALPGSQADDFLDWYRPWAQRYARARIAAQTALAAVKSPDAVRAATAKIEQLDAGQLIVAENLAAVEILRDCLQKPPLASDADDLWQTQFDSSAPAALLSESETGGERNPHALSFYTIGTADIGGRLIAALAILIIMIFVHQGVRRGFLPAPARRRPHLLGVTAGLFWWLFLTPSPFGLVIVAVCLASSLRSGWRNKRCNDSMIVPLN